MNQPSPCPVPSPPLSAAVAAALSDRPFSDSHVAKVLKLAAPYIMHDSEFGQGVYRLAHRTFVEHYLRSDRRSSRYGSR